MDKCIYNNTPLYAFNIFDEYENVIVPKEEEYRKLSRENKLTCDECGREVIFKFGPVKGSYFAHKYDLYGEPCDYKPESEEHLNGKKLLFRKLLKDIPNCDATIRHKLPNKKIADIHAKLHTGEEFIIEFVKNINTYSTLTDKFNFYRDSNIKAIWILSSKSIDLHSVENEVDLNFSFRKLDSESDYVIYFDVDTHKFSFVKNLTIKSPYTNRLLFSEVLSKCYKENECHFIPSGELMSPFKDYIEKIKFEILENDKQAYLKMESERKALEEARKISEEKRRVIEEKRKAKKLQEEHFSAIQQDSFFGTSTVIEVKNNDTEASKVNQTSLFDNNPLSTESYFTNNNKANRPRYSSAQTAYSVGTKKYMNKYFTRVRMSVNGDMMAFNLLKSTIEIYGNSDSIKDICDCFDYFIDRNYPNAKVLKEKLLIETGFESYV